MDKRNIIKYLVPVLAFIIGGFSYYLLSISILQPPLYKMNSIQNIVSKSINDVESDIERYKLIDSTSKKLMEKIDRICDTLKYVKRDPLFTPNIRNTIFEYEVYEIFIEPIYDVLNNFDIVLSIKYVPQNIYSIWSDDDIDNKQISEKKVINESEEISKIFYKDFRQPSINKFIEDKDSNALKESYNGNSFNKKMESFAKSLYSLKRSMTETNFSAKENLKKSEDLKKNYTSDFASIEVANVNKITLYLAFPLFAAIVILLFAIPRLYVGSDVQKLFFEKNTIKEVITIFMLISSIILLGLSKILTSEVIGTLLGGISVYVLQRGLENKKNNENHPATETGKPQDAKNLTQKEDTKKTQGDKTAKSNDNISNPEDKTGKA